MKQIEDQFGHVRNQYIGPKINLFSDTRWITFIQSYTLKITGLKAHEIELNDTTDSGLFEVVLSDGGIIFLDRVLLQELYRRSLG